MQKPKRKSLWRKLLFGLPGLFIFILLALLASFWIWSSIAERKIANLLQEIKARGEPTSAEELPDCFPLPQGAEDVTALWIKGLQPLDSDDFQAEAQAFPHVQESNPFAPQVSLTLDQLPAAEAFLKTYQSSLDAFHEAAKRGGYARFPVDYSQGVFPEAPFTSNARFISRLVRLELDVHALNENPAGAARCLKTLVTAPRCLEYEPTYYSHLTVNAMHILAAEAVAEKIGVLELSLEDLQQLRALLLNISPKDSMRRAFMGERAFGYTVLRNPSRFSEVHPYALPYSYDIAYYLQFMTGVIRSLDAPYPQCNYGIASYAESLRQDQASFLGQRTLTYTTALAPLTSPYVVATGRTISLLQAAEVGVAIQQHFRKNRRLPNSLEEIASQWPTGVPKDLHSKQGAMQYKIRDNGFVIYSIGGNEKDDGGKLTEPNPVRGDWGLFFPLK